MANMSYCRFENTSSDLSDCFEHINDRLKSKEEIRARLRLIESCKAILEAVGFDIDMDQEPKIDEDEDEDD